MLLRYVHKDYDTEVAHALTLAILLKETQHFGGSYHVEISLGGFAINDVN